MGCEWLLMLQETLKLNESVIKGLHADDLVFYAVHKLFKVGDSLFEVFLFLIVEVGKIDVFNA